MGDMVSTWKEEYEGMADREILIDMAARMRALEQQVRNRPACPSPKCAQHDEAIEDLDDRVEDLEEKDKNRKDVRRTWVDYLINGIIGFGGVLLGFFGRGS